MLDRINNIECIAIRMYNVNQVHMKAFKSKAMYFANWSDISFVNSGTSNL